MSVVTVSYTPLDAPGGVPRFNRDIHRAFPGSKHYSWWDICQAQGWDPNSQNVSEWDKAQVLNAWLKWTKKVTRETVVIADSFWAGGLEDMPLCISHQHGNWGHITYQDRQLGAKPEFPDHERAQTNFRHRYIKAGRKMTAVSDFIATQMWLQWGINSKVINNGIDLTMYTPATKRIDRKRPIVVHFVTNNNKGFDHINAVNQMVDADVWLLDEAAERLMMPKYQALAQADLVVHPSAHEGNSYAVLETLACDVPIVAYDVGLLYAARLECAPVGDIMQRVDRSVTNTVEAVKKALKYGWSCTPDPRRWVSKFSIDSFSKSWQEHVNGLL